MSFGSHRTCGSHPDPDFPGTGIKLQVKFKGIIQMGEYQILFPRLSKDLMNELREVIATTTGFKITQIGAIRCGVVDIVMDTDCMYLKEGETLTVTLID